MMKQTDRLIHSLKRLEKAVDGLLSLKYVGQPRDDHGRFASGGGGAGGSMAPDTGGSFGGGSGGGSSGSGSGASQGSGKHNVQLPKNPKKLNIDTAAEALAQMGFELKPLGFDMNAMEAQYQITDRNGNANTMGSTAMREMIYNARS